MSLLTVRTFPRGYVARFATRAHEMPALELHVMRGVAFWVSELGQVMCELPICLA